MIVDHMFAGRIMAKYTRPGSSEGRNERLVFLTLRREPANTSGRMESPSVWSTYQLLLRFYMTWQNYVRSGQRFLVNWNLIAETLAKNIHMEYRFRNNKISRSYNQYAAFWNIAEIFENRGRRPDLAKKAERELLRMLSGEFYRWNSDRQRKEIERSVSHHIKSRQMRERETLQRLEQYVTRRNLITGQALSTQIDIWKSEILYTCLSILEKEQTLSILRPQGMVQMENLVREHVSEPSAKHMEKQRRTLYRTARYLMRDYNRITEKSRFIETYRKSVQEKAADEFSAELIFRRAHTETQKESADGSKRLSGEQQFQIRRTQSYQEELGNTKRMVGMLEEQMKVQETILAELRRKLVATVSTPEANIKKITGEVMRQMEREMHLERLRRGL